MIKTVKQSTSDIYINKIWEFNERLGMRILDSHVLLNAEYHHTTARLSLASTVNLKRRKIVEGEGWGKNWESGYFKLTATVPKEWKGRAISADIELSGEVLVYDRHGTPLYGLTNGSVAHSYEFPGAAPAPRKGIGQTDLTLGAPTRAKEVRKSRSLPRRLQIRSSGSHLPTTSNAMIPLASGPFTPR